MLQKLRERMGRDEGFTLIELLVVMLILGILAAIAIPTFFNQREKAQDADAKAMAKASQTSIETYATDNQGDYTGATAAALNAIEGTVDPAVVTVNSATASDYSITVDSPDTGNTFTINRTAGSFAYPCTTAGDGGCPSSGNWGG